MIESHTDGHAMIALAGEIDIAVVDGIAAQVAAALDAIPAGLILRMRDVTFIDSTGIGALVAARLSCLALEVPFAIHDPSAPVVRVLRLTGLDEVMAIRPDPVAAGEEGAG